MTVPVPIRRLVKRSQEDTQWAARRGLAEVRELLPTYWVEHPRGVFKDPHSGDCLIPMPHANGDIKYHYTRERRVFHFSTLDEVKRWIR